MFTASEVVCTEPLKVCTKPKKCALVCTVRSVCSADVPGRLPGNICASEALLRVFVFVLACVSAVDIHYYSVYLLCKQALYAVPTYTIRLVVCIGVRECNAKDTHSHWSDDLYMHCTQPCARLPVCPKAYHTCAAPLGGAELATPGVLLMIQHILRLRLLPHLPQCSTSRHSRRRQIVIPHICRTSYPSPPIALVPVGHSAQT